MVAARERGRWDLAQYFQHATLDAELSSSFIKYRGNKNYRKQDRSREPSNGLNLLIWRSCQIYFFGLETFTLEVLAKLDNANTYKYKVKIFMRSWFQRSSRVCSEQYRAAAGTLQVHPAHNSTTKENIKPSQVSGWQSSRFLRLTGPTGPTSSSHSHKLFTMPSPEKKAKGTWFDQESLLCKF